MLASRLLMVGIPWMMMAAQYQRTLETLFGCFLYSVRFITESNIRLGSGRAPRGTMLGRTERAYVHPAAPSCGSMMFYRYC